MKFLRLVTDWLLPRLGVALVLAIVLGVCIYKVALPPVIMSVYKHEMPHHEFAPPNASHGAGSSDIVYYSSTYDCRGGDLVISGTVPDAAYWQFGIYDVYVRAQEGGHLNNRTVEVDANGSFQLVITENPRGKPNTLDCSFARKGIVIYRVVLPKSEVSKPIFVSG